MTTRGPVLAELTVEECLELAGGLPVGRFAVAHPGEPPLVVPVNFVLDGEAVMFRTEPGLKLRWLRQQPASFEVDYIDHVQHTGWSVLFQGLAYEATPGEIQRAGVAVEPWVGQKRIWIRLMATSVTGRRIALEQLAPDPRGYL